MSADALAIRRAVAATRRVCRAADVDNIARVCIARDVPLGTVKALLFDLISEATEARPAHVPFRRAPLAAQLGAGRRRA